MNVDATRVGGGPRNQDQKVRRNENRWVGQNSGRIFKKSTYRSDQRKEREDLHDDTNRRGGQ